MAAVGFFPVLIYFSSKDMSTPLWMFSQWFMGKMGEGRK